jgi:hypothetical protein
MKLSIDSKQSLNGSPTVMSEDEEGGGRRGEEEIRDTDKARSGSA